MNPAFGRLGSSDTKNKVVGTFLGILIYFVCVDAINLVRLPLRRKLWDSIDKVKQRVREKRKEMQGEI